MPPVLRCLIKASIRIAHMPRLSLWSVTGSNSMWHPLKFRIKHSCTCKWSSLFKAHCTCVPPTLPKSCKLCWHFQAVPPSGGSVTCQVFRTHCLVGPGGTAHLIDASEQIAYVHLCRVAALHRWLLFTPILATDRRKPWDSPFISEKLSRSTNLETI